MITINETGARDTFLVTVLRSAVSSDCELIHRMLNQWASNVIEMVKPDYKDKLPLAHLGFRFVRSGIAFDFYTKPKDMPLALELAHVIDDVAFPDDSQRDSLEVADYVCRALARIDRNIGALDERLVGLEDSVGVLEEEREDEASDHVRDEIARLDRNIGGLGKRQAELADAVTDHGEQLVELADAVANLENNLSAPDERLTEAEDSVRALDERLTDLEESVMALDERLTSREEQDEP